MVQGMKDLVAKDHEVVLTCHVQYIELRLCINANASSVHEQSVRNTVERSRKIAAAYGLLGLFRMIIRVFGVMRDVNK
jgi:hypothetical protein